MFDREKLREIRTFPSLVKYLRDELDWPIEADDFEDLTFDYEPEELGIDAKTAAKIEGIKQLRPLVTNQPWGVFFVKFEPKRLPVVALRRILSRLVIKKRVSARSADMASWNLDDLLFISNYGETDERHMTFAHFAQDERMGDLPTLKILGWDDADTVLHIDHVHQELKEKLHWPENVNDLDPWREKWSSAFILRHREVITTSKELAVRLADLARRIRRRANQVLSIETEHGPLRKLHKAFQEALIHDLGHDDFADMYAQTITYGLLAARVSRPIGIKAETLADMVPITNPFLKEMLSTFLTVGGRKGKMDFDELGVREVVELLNSPDTHMEDVLRDFGDRTRQEDPVINFYELFLAEYDKKKKVERGVFYTPQPVVSYIVRSVHELLQKEFGLEDGLADTTTWGEMANKKPAVKIPDGVPSDEPFVNILDIATGTATFLVEVVDIVHKTMMAKWQKQGLNEKRCRAAWNDYVPKHLLPRLHGFELMMAPYAIAHMKLGLKLFETGYRFGSEERLHIYLTNSLEPPSLVADDKLADLFSALGHEAQAVNAIKRDKRFTVVIGNPPYSIQSGNLSEDARSLIEPYKMIDGERIRERNALQFEKNLQDDYIKFIRLGEILIKSSGAGILGYISNNSFLDSRSFRGMRQHLMSTMPRIYVLDLHGSQKKKESDDRGKRDENVFTIQQGVCISLMLSMSEQGCSVKREDKLGSRADKYGFLSSSSSFQTAWRSLNPRAPFYLFADVDAARESEYFQAPSLRDIFKRFSSGIKTHKDRFAYAFTIAEMEERLSQFVDYQTLDEDFRLAYNLKDTPLWQLSTARKRLREDKAKIPVIKALYRPFDTRAIAYSDDIVRYTARPTMRHFDGKKNLGLLLSQQQITEGFAHVFVSRMPSDCQSVSNKSREGTSVFPLLVSQGASEKTSPSLFDGMKFESNIKPQFLSTIANLLAIEKIDSLDFFFYAYAILHSQTYRKRYASFLKSDFPRLPLTPSLELFQTLIVFGDELVSLHLMESPKLNKPVTKFMGKGDNEVAKVGYENQTVWINSAQGFQSVAEAVWNFHIGGYQVCEKWLKDRKGRVLSNEDINHYHKIVVAISETIRLMDEIDRVIEKHGGWPGAFTTVRDVQLKKDEAAVPVHPQEEFIISLIKRLRTGKNKGIHSVFSGFNGLFKEKFPGEKPQAWTKKLAQEGRIITTPIKGKGKEYQMIYLPEDAPKS